MTRGKTIRFVKNFYRYFLVLATLIVFYVGPISLVLVVCYAWMMFLLIQALAEKIKE
jgi:hypothetical protein